MPRLLMRSIVVMFLVLPFAGCGGSGTDIASVRDCLKDLGLKVEAPPTTDKDVEEGVFATSDLTGGTKADAEFTFALAAIVPGQAARERFVEQSKSFDSSTKRDGKLQFESGTDGDYVWVAGGQKGSEDFDAVRDCVKP